MKGFTVAALSGLAALAAAQSTTVELSPMEKCALDCGDKDICCRAACANVPCPSDAMANRTTECAMNCDQGDGSPEDTKKYAECQSQCINSYFFTGTATLPSSATPTSDSEGGDDAAQTNSAGEPTGTPSSSDDASESASGSETASASATATDTGLANANIPLGSSAAGIVGLVMAALAL